MSRTETATCRDCGWTGPVEETEELRNVWDRVLPGDVMPAGQCPVEGCGGAAMLDREHPRMVDLRPEMEALMLDLDLLHRNIYSGRLRVPVGNYVKQLADCARKALAAGLRHECPPMQPVCTTCGGTGVRIDAWARWDTRWQRWELHEICEATAICADCDIECAYSMMPVEEAE